MSIISFLLLRITHSYQRQLEDLSTIDHLTGVNNRFSCERLLSYEMRRSERYGYEVAVLLFDIDDFKQINDTHGHAIPRRSHGSTRRTHIDRCGS